MVNVGSGIVFGLKNLGVEKICDTRVYTTQIEVLILLCTGLWLDIGFQSFGFIDCSS